MSTRDDRDRGVETDTRLAVLEVGGRLESAPSSDLVAFAFADGLEAQVELARGVGLADIAHTVMLIEAGLAPHADGCRLLEGLIELQAGATDFEPNAALGDIVTNREAWLRDRGSPVGWLGAGRARREATTVAYHLLVRDRARELAAGLVDFGLSLVDHAETHRQTLLPDYTYLQAGQPTSFGHYLLTTVYGVQRDLERVRGLHRRVDRSPAGCGSANGSTLGQDRERLAELLGFGGLVAHARDAMWQADLAIEAMSVVAAALVNASRLAEDLQVFASVEFGLVELDDAHSRASKIMPQKKNPYALTWVRAAANRALGDWMSVAAAGRMPSGQPDSRLLAYERVPASLRSSRQVFRLLGGVVRGLRVDAIRGRQSLSSGFAMATDLAEHLVLEAGVDFRQAHLIVARLVSALDDAGGDFASLSASALDRAAHEVLGRTLGPLDETGLAAALEPLAALARRQGPGSAAPESVDQMLADSRSALHAHREWELATRRRVGAAEGALISRARELVEEGR